LLQERKFRELYDKVRFLNEVNIDFSMDISNFNSGKCSLLNCLFSISIFPLYLFMTIITMLILFII
jgi:hypothetical protein